VNLEPSELRISDTEREDAITKLGEHMSVGRLGVDEYGERTAKVATARTRGELLALFTDLPDPQPSFGQAISRAAPAASAPVRRPASWDERPLVQRIWGAMVPLSAIVALVLFLTVFREWFVFLMPAAIAIVGGAIWGEDWKHDRHHHRHDDRRRLGRGD
jgi:hypothetical protein